MVAKVYMPRPIRGKGLLSMDMNLDEFEGDALDGIDFLLSMEKRIEDFFGERNIESRKNHDDW